MGDRGRERDGRENEREIEEMEGGRDERQKRRERERARERETIPHHAVPFPHKIFTAKARPTRQIDQYPWYPDWPQRKKNGYPSPLSLLFNMARS